MSTSTRGFIYAALAGALFCTQPASTYAQDATSEPEGYIAEPDLIQRAVVFMDRHGQTERTNGFYADFANMIPGAGWISVGPGYRRWYRQDRLFVDASTAVSWRGYKTAQGRIELPRIASSRLALGAQARWQDFTQVSYFGQGPATLDSNQSQYRVKARAVGGYATLRPAQWLGIGAQLGWMKPSVLPPAGWFASDHPATQDLVPTDPVFTLAEQPTFVHTEASITADTRDFPGHPTDGGLIRVAAADYRADAGAFSFKRYEAEAVRFLPVADSRLVVAVHGWLVASDPAEGQVLPFYLLPSLGGHNTLRAYPDYRFHDRNLVLVNSELRVAMMTHVDASVFVDAGNVAAHLGDLNLDRRSYGAGLRVHTRRQTFARLDVARGDEGWRLVVRLSEPFDLSRLARRTPAVPFVP